MREFPEWLLKDLRALAPVFSVSWHRWEDAEGVCPLIGMPFTREVQPDGMVEFVVSVGQGGRYSWTEKPSDVSEGRFVIFETNQGRLCKLFDLVYHDGTPIDPVSNGRLIINELGARIGAWREAEAEVLSREKKAKERAENARPFEEAMHDSLADGFRRDNSYAQVSVPAGFTKTDGGIIVPVN